MNDNEPIDVRATLRSFIATNKISKPHAVSQVERTLPALDEFFAAVAAHRDDPSETNRIRLAVAHGRAQGINVKPAAKKENSDSTAGGSPSTADSNAAASETEQG